VRTQIQVMLDLQNTMNGKVHPEWREQNFEWYRAIWIECAELMDHYGWKWWKKQTPDIEQVMLEVIDIWHFGLSMLLVNNVSAETIERELTSALRIAPPTSFHKAVEVFAGNTLTTQEFSIETFAGLLQTTDMSFDSLYIGYIGKNVLNLFRQDHGYKEGSYQKLWGGQEDNEHLVDIVQSIDSKSADFKEVLYKELFHRYQSLCV
jgi:dimeric dUTPase (all-alpha-NTP-PPase superfamily)